MIKVGLTGSVGMGKTTTAQVFAKFGCAVWDADKTVHKLYSKGGKAVVKVAKLFPSLAEDKYISRSRLKVLLKNEPKKLKELEDIVHPLIIEDRYNFEKNTNADVAVFEIPLLFETGADKEMDKTVCVFTSTKKQIERLKSRNNGYDDFYKELMSKQMPSDEKCDRADYVIETTSHTVVEKRVIEILDILRA
tara:strand:- start:1503 stop:2078 length:576 start_codon:yes stop_codon:yes gene_type:complete